MKTHFYAIGFTVVVLAVIFGFYAFPQSFTLAPVPPNRPELVCGAIIEASLLALDFEEVPENELVEWVSERYGERRLINEWDQEGKDLSEVILAGAPHNWGIRYTWYTYIATYDATRPEQLQFRGRFYENYVVDDKPLSDLTIEFEVELTLDEVSKCYGLPSHYATSHRFYDSPSWFSPSYNTNHFALYYPKQGLTFFDYRDIEGGIPSHLRVNAYTPVKSVTIMSPFEVEQEMRGAYPFSGKWEVMNR